jgi:tetratricopeptide (TPR) repeat protein
VLFAIWFVWLSQAAPSTQPPREVTTLERWAHAVQQHQQGRPDAHAAAVAVWPRSDLQLVLATLQDLRDILPRGFSGGGSPRNRKDITTRSGYRLSAFEVQTMLGLTDEEARRGDISRLVRRGALFHSDLAMLAQDGLLLATEPLSPGTNFLSRSTRVDDGRIQGPDPTDRHWAMARGLLDYVRPDPGADQWVHLWYRAAAARMRRDSLLGPAEPLLERGQQLFPGDPELSFAAGCLHEALASPTVQSVFAAAAIPPGARTASFLPGPHWSQAARLFSSVLAVRAAWTEARLRLGRVLGLMGRHKDSAAELRRALEEASDPLLVYWASLFLGNEEQALGHDEDARSCYERALTCRPRAQAPHLALSQLARRQGNREEAVAEIRAVMALPPDEPARYDPLWDYFGSLSTVADALFQELREQLEKGGASGEGARR